jgi:hypothetical protein
VLDIIIATSEPLLQQGKKLIQRFENVQRAQQEFWKRWIEEVFPQKLVQSKWKREKRDLQVGDIVLRKDETAAGQTYKYAKVVKVHTSTDGKVRAADIEYRLPGESVFRATTRPIHKLVLIIPVEEQAAAVDKVGEAEAAPLAPGCVRIKPVVGSQEEAGTREKEASPGPTPPPPQSKGVSKPVAKPKKVVARRKAGKQTRTIIVTSPKEEAEMVDIGTQPRKRGRPRKNPVVVPPDPHKGSVLRPRKGKCADPVYEDAILRGIGGGPQAGIRSVS